MSQRTFTPRSIVSQVELTGTIQQIWRGIAFPDDVWLAWSGNGNAAIRFQWPLPATAPAVGANLQEFKFMVRKTASGGNAVPITVNIYQNDTLIDTRTFEVTNAVSEVLSVFWNASSLVSPDASLLDLEIVQTAGGTGNPSNRRSFELNTAEWIHDDQIGNMRLVQTRACDGQCCRESPRFPTPDGLDCEFRNPGVGKEFGGCQIQENVTLRSGIQGIDSIVFPGRDALEVFIETCIEWPQNTPERFQTTTDTGGCCWQWEPIS